MTVIAEVVQEDDPAYIAEGKVGSGSGDEFSAIMIAASAQVVFSWYCEISE